MPDKIVRVGCSVLNGVMIQLHKPGYDDGTGDGVRPFVKDGPGIRLNGPPAILAGAGNSDGQGQKPGETEVDAEWMGKWLEQHVLDPLVVGKYVFIIESEEPAPEVLPATEAANPTA